MNCKENLAGPEQSVHQLPVKQRVLLKQCRESPQASEAVEERALSTLVELLLCLQKGPVNFQQIVPKDTQLPNEMGRAVAQWLEFRKAHLVSPTFLAKVSQVEGEVKDSILKPCQSK